MFDWKAAVKTFAPMLGTALGGPVVGTATKMLSDALLGKENANEDELAKAIQNASPDDILKIKQAEQNFVLKMKELKIKEKDLVFEDKKSAREMQVKTKSKTPAVLAYLLTAMVGTMVYGLMFYAIPEGNKDIIHIVFGSVMTAWIGATQFFHGATINDEDR